MKNEVSPSFLYYLWLPFLQMPALDSPEDDVIPRPEVPPVEYREEVSGHHILTMDDSERNHQFDSGDEREEIFQPHDTQAGLDDHFEQHREILRALHTAVGADNSIEEEVEEEEIDLAGADEGSEWLTDVEDVDADADADADAREYVYFCLSTLLSR